MSWQSTSSLKKSHTCASCAKPGSWAMGQQRHTKSSSIQVRAWVLKRCLQGTNTKEKMSLIPEYYCRMEGSGVHTLEKRKLVQEADTAEEVPSCQDQTKRCKIATHSAPASVPHLLDIALQPRWYCKTISCGTGHWIYKSNRGYWWCDKCDIAGDKKSW